MAYTGFLHRDGFQSYMTRYDDNFPHSFAVSSNYSSQQKMRKSHNLCMVTSHLSVSPFPLSQGKLSIAIEELNKGDRVHSDQYVMVGGLGRDWAYTDKDCGWKPNQMTMLESNRTKLNKGPLHSPKSTQHTVVCALKYHICFPGLPIQLFKALVQKR